MFVGECVAVQDFELQRQVLCALNAILYEQLQFKGNECDYYNPMNSYIHQVSSATRTTVNHCFLTHGVKR